ncbi:multidrug transporter subunit MdtD [Serratia marcescens]|nr:multidrug transporter subunit MdtD [Serratia marcescens]
MKHTATVRWQLWIVAFGFFMQTLDTTIVNTALPSMAASLGENPLRMQSVIVAYVLTVAVTLPASGWLADKVGVQRVFFSAIVLFTLGSLLCARSATLNELIASRVLQGIGGAMMGPALGGLLVQYASWHWIFLINIPVGIVGAIATLLLMPNYQMQTRRFDLSGFFLLAIGMASLTLALDGHKGMGLTGGAIAGLVALGAAALLGYVWHAYGNSRALFSLRLLRTPTYKIGLLASLLGRIGSGMLPFMTPLFLQVGMGFTPFHAGLMMIPMIIGSMGMKRIVVQVVNRFGYRNVLVAATLLLALVSLSFLLAAMLGWLWLLPVILFFQGMVNALRFSAMNTLTLKDLPDRLASSGNSLLSMVMQLSMSLGVSVAGILIGSFAHHQAVADSPAIHSAFIYSYCCMALIIALPALAFARVPADSAPNRTLAKEPGTGSTRLQ